MKLTTAAAARLLSIPVDEVSSVAQAPAGDVIVTRDGSTYVMVPNDQPDGAGQTGLMFLTAPHDGYVPGFPVYCLPDNDEPDVDGDAGNSPADISKLNKAELVEHATALGIEVDDKMTKAEILAAIEAV